MGIESCEHRSDTGRLKRIAAARRALGILGECEKIWGNGTKWGIWLGVEPADLELAKAPFLCLSLKHLSR